jgi:beta-galactosidase
VGGPPWLPPMSAADQQQVTGGVLAGGCRGLCFFMVVDRERWYGAPVDVRGELRPPAAWLSNLLAALRSLNWTRLRRRARAAVVMSRAESRFAIASSLVDPLSPVVTELVARGLGPGGAAELARDPSAALHRRWIAAVIAALDAEGIPFALLDEEAPEEAWSQQTLLVAPTLDRVDRALWRRLREAAERGAQVIAGPARPTRDEIDQPLGEDARIPRRLGLMRPDSIEDIAGLAADLASAAGGAGDWRLGPPLHLSLFEDSSGVARAAAVGNPGPRAARAQLDAPGAAELRDVETGERLVADGGRIAVDVAPFAVRLFAVSLPPVDPSSGNP